MTNSTSATPRTDEQVRKVIDANPFPLGAGAEYDCVPASFARQLEVECNELRERLADSEKGSRLEYLDHCQTKERLAGMEADALRYRWLRAYRWHSEVDEGIIDAAIAAHAARKPHET